VRIVIARSDQFQREMRRIGFVTKLIDDGKMTVENACSFI
jgi:hypothetical protein